MSTGNDFDGSGTSSSNELDSTVLCVCPRVPQELVAGRPKKPVSRAYLAAALYLVNTSPQGVRSAGRPSTTRARSVPADVMGAKVFSSATARRMSWHAERRESSISESFAEELGNNNNGANRICQYSRELARNCAAHHARIRRYEFIIAEGVNEVDDDDDDDYGDDDDDDDDDDDYGDDDSVAEYGAAAANDAKRHAPVSGAFRRRTNGWQSVMAIVLVVLLLIVLYNTFFKSSQLISYILK